MIDPYDEKLINPNSYNLRLHNDLLTYTDEILDMKKPLNTEKITIPEDGLIFRPGKLYLGRTYEKTSSNSFVPNKKADTHFRYREDSQLVQEWEKLQARLEVIKTIRNAIIHSLGFMPYRTVYQDFNVKNTGIIIKSTINCC